MAVAPVPSDRVFADRVEAGRLLGERMRAELATDGADLVLGLPRGGVPIAAEVARALDAPLDVLVVRKLGAPATRSTRSGRSDRAVRPCCPRRAR
ncbi:phosphoribosyltransferase family protein [Protaetiibacter sp. SSC-01]|uniref:phosphoribosyltransferase family protein n=1 Tax=Protaetiibacter sp. SSC-01 TaxID=2759943 RepID=UPI001CA452BE|nr:phosphoribosyltransferase family protein [Protaetiibacter sp. SSC-01]